MEEAGSLGLEQLVKSLSDTFLADVDYFAISDSYWLGSSRPCVTNGLRGNAYFFVEIECAQKDLHSGVYGGAVHEAMADLFQLMSKLTDQNHNILVPGLMDDVLPVSMEDHLALEALDFDVTEFKEDVGTSKLRFDDKANLLAHRWMLPSLSIHGIEGNYPANYQNFNLLFSLTRSFFRARRQDGDSAQNNRQVLHSPGSRPESRQNWRPSGEVPRGGVSEVGLTK